MDYGDGAAAYLRRLCSLLHADEIREEEYGYRLLLAAAGSVVLWDEQQRDRVDETSGTAGGVKIERSDE